VPVRRIWVAALALVAPLLVGCGAAADAQRGTDRVVYVAVGASDTVGIGTRDPARHAWPNVFARMALPSDADVHNLGIAGATTEEAIRRELPRALALRPTIATVWLNVNDLTRAVPPDVYEARLRHLLDALRRGGRTRVLVATTPKLDSLPAYRRCVDTPGSCVIGSFVPGPSLVALAVEAYNEAIRSAAADTGSIVVDLHALGDVPAEHPGWISADGFHPSAEGYRHVAAAFASALGGA
jgi:lysophospholipase L1-like esterase